MLDENVSITSLEPAPKIQDSPIHQHHDVATLGAKDGRAQYRKSQRDREDKKGKRSGKDEGDKRSGEGHRGNKVNLVVQENSSSEVNVYHHIIYIF